MRDDLLARCALADTGLPPHSHAHSTRLQPVHHPLTPSFRASGARGRHCLAADAPAGRTLLAGA
jgi:hypothetical protein